MYSDLNSLLEILQTAKAYYEEMEQTMSAEYDLAYSLAELLDKRKMPDNYYKIVELISRIEVKIEAQTDTSSGEYV